MSVYNCERYVAEAVESILGQTFTDFEFIIIDDGSTDRSLSILRRFAQRDGRIRLVSRGNRGLTRSLNEGLGLARGEFIARMDADDISLPERLERQVEYLRAHPECVALGCRLYLIDPDGDPLMEEPRPTTHEDIMQMLLRGSGAIPHPGAMIRRTDLCAIGGYNEEFKAAQDLDLWLRLSERRQLANLDEVLVRYRMHFGSVSVGSRQVQVSFAERAVREARLRRGQTPERLPLALSPPRSRRDTPLEMQRRWAWMALGAGNVKTARKHARRVLMQAPWSKESWRVMLCALRGW